MGNPRTMANAFAQLHGEVYASSQKAAAQMQRRFHTLFPTGREIIYNDSNSTKVLNRWGPVTGDINTRKGFGQHCGYNLSSFGLAVGVDRALTSNILAGVAAGYDNGYQNFKSLDSTGQFDSFRTAVYASWYNRKFFVDSYAGYTKTLHSTRREINFSDYRTTAHGRYNDDLVSIGVEFGRTIWKGKTLLTPSAGLHYITIGSPSLTETEGGDANLFVYGNRYQSLRMPVGVKVTQMFDVRGITLMPEVKVSFARELANDSARVRTEFAERALLGVPFEADSGKWGRSSGRLGVGLNALFTDRLKFRLEYDHEIYNYTTSNTFSMVLGAYW
jgi:outer membrane autotransporter protein